MSTSGIGIQSTPSMDKSNEKGAAGDPTAPKV